MIKPRVALFAYTEGKLRESVYLKRKPIADREVTRFINRLSEVEFVIPPKPEIRCKSDVIDNIKYIDACGVDAVVLLVPIFVTPSLVAHTARLLGRPCALVGNESEDTFSQVSVLACGGAIDQLGILCKRIPGDVDDEDCRNELLSFLNAARAKCALKGKTFGCFGGKSLGINTGTADPVLWETVFGIDIEHIDQFEIVRRAERVSCCEVAKYKQWLKENLGNVVYDGSSFGEKQFDRQIRSHIATVDIIHSFELDFVGIKCQPELSNGYCLQCLNVTLLNDPYGPYGEKEPVVCSCEADADGALTMEILKLISGGRPTALADIISVKSNQMTSANCGAMSTYFASYSRNPRENMSKAVMVPHTFGDAGGGAIHFITGEAKLTFARLFRKRNTYYMGMFSGNSVPNASVNPGLWPRPLIFVHTNLDKTRFMGTFGSNHIHCVEGSFKQELKEFCSLTGIECIDYDIEQKVCCTRGEINSVL